MSLSLSYQWKQEPVSPLNSEESLVLDDVALYVTAEATEQLNLKAEFEFVSCKSKAKIATKLLEGLEQLENLDDFIKEDFDHLIDSEQFSDWLEDKMLPNFDDIELIRSGSNFSLKTEQAAVPDTESLLQEFEHVYGAVEQNHGTLTPPQSPPYKPFLTTLQPLITQPVYSDVLAYSQPSIQIPIEYQSQISQTDVAHELAVVDELIRSRAEDLIQYPSSPASNSSSSNFDDSSSDDPEWIPETIEPSNFVPVIKATSRKRSKPYFRAPEDKKSRKKEQNKNAATRYRIKKKAEVTEILEEERLLSEKNDTLECKIADLQKEIKYLKGLMRDVFKAKGLIH